MPVNNGISQQPITLFILRNGRVFARNLRGQPMYWLECYLLASGGNIIHNITFSGSQPLGIIV
ncbi:MAG TPA: hypothetical protein VHV10_08225, partial [Ktedonobacteraceae bacterium]|nr:hypothetical protein [Ktedonobacteraceae bacterium]